MPEPVDCSRIDRSIYYTPLLPIGQNFLTMCTLYYRSKTSCKVEIPYILHPSMTCCLVA